MLGVHPAVLSPELLSLFFQLQSAPLQALRNLTQENPEEGEGNQGVAMLRETDPLACHIPSRHQEQNGEQSGTEPGAESVTNTEEHGDEEKGSRIDAKPTGITGND